MNIYTGERGSGKTRALIVNALVDESAILCVPHVSQRNEIVKKYPELRRRVVTHFDVLGKSDTLRGRVGHLLIDEVGLLLGSIIHYFPVDAISQTGRIIRL